jgi:hypothetical protein
LDADSAVRSCQVFFSPLVMMLSGGRDDLPRCEDLDQKLPSARPLPTRAIVSVVLNWMSSVFGKFGASFQVIAARNLATADMASMPLAAPAASPAA